MWFTWGFLEILIQRKENEQSSAEFLFKAKYEVALCEYYPVLQHGF